MSKFSERLKEYMDEAGLSQTALEERTGIWHTDISAYLSDTHTPSFTNFVRLLNEFNCSADVLLGLKDFSTNETLHPVPPFGPQLRSLLKSHGVSQQRLQREMHVSASVLYKWLNGKSQPSTDSLIRLAKYFECSVDYLIGRVR